MSDAIDSDPEQLRSRSTSLDEVAAAVQDIVERHRQRVAALGDCWGDDTIGARFADRYRPARDEFGEYVDKLVQGVRSSTDAVRESADRLSRTESDNADAARTPAGGAGAPVTATEQVVTVARRDDSAAGHG